jgi:outer membrane receptor protein involved in Fe transport
VDQFLDLDSSARTTMKSTFWTADAQIGYRFPNRYGSVALEARNLTDREFEFYERSLQDTVIPARTVALRLKLTY